MNTQFFIGMHKFEDLLDLPGDSRLMLTTVNEVQRGAHPTLEFQKFSIIAARLDNTAGVCYYWRFHTGTVHSQFSDAKHDAAVKRTHAALSLLTDYAYHVCGFRITKAVIATPKDYTFLDGSTDLIVYDKGADTYRGTPLSGHEHDEEEPNRETVIAECYYCGKTFGAGFDAGDPADSNLRQCCPDCHDKGSFAEPEARAA